MMFIPIGLMCYTNISRIHVNISETNSIKFSLVEIIVMILLFRILDVSKKSIMIFFSILTIFMIIIAIDSKALFSEYAKIGIYLPKLVFPFEIDVISTVVVSPFLGIFIFLKQYDILNKACYIVPLIMSILFLVSIQILKFKQMNHKSGEIKNER